MLAPELGDRIAVQEATVRKYITSARKSLIEQFRKKDEVADNGDAGRDADAGAKPLTSRAEPSHGVN